MLNMIRMDLYRLFRTKSMYVIWIIMTASILLTTFLSKTDYEAIMEDNNMNQTTTLSDTSEDNSVENINIGMSVQLPTEPGEKVTVMDIFFANSQGKFYALFMVIFSVIFSTADISSGYIKNIGGQVSKRAMLIVSRAVALAVFTVITFAGAFALQIVFNRIAFGEILIGMEDNGLLYLLTQLVLHYAIVVICMAVAVIVKNNVVSMIFAVCLTMNLMSIVYSGINNIVESLGVKNFQVYRYTVTGEIPLLTANPAIKECLMALGVAVIFILVMTAAGSIVFQKRDI